GERARLRERAQQARVPPAVPAAAAGRGGAVSAMTMTEKILARAAGKSAVEPGDNVWVRADVLMTHDVCGPGTIGIFKREFGRQARVWDRDRIVLIPDHYIFTKDDKAHRNVDILREFAREQDQPHLYDVGTPRYKGVCHIALAEEGHTRPGEVLFGTDSHTCTAGAFNQFATGIGNTDAAFVLGTGKLLVKVPPTMRFVFEGEIPAYILAKDLILQIIGDIGVDGATYRAMEFAGEAVMRLSMEERTARGRGHLPRAVHHGRRARAPHGDDRWPPAARHLQGRRLPDLARRLVRGVPGRPARYLRSHQWPGGLHLDHQPQLPRPHGREGGTGLPRLALHRRRLGDHRPHHRPAGAPPMTITG